MIKVVINWSKNLLSRQRKKSTYKSVHKLKANQICYTLAAFLYHTYACVLACVRARACVAVKRAAK